MADNLFSVASASFSFQQLLIFIPLAFLLLLQWKMSAAIRYILFSSAIAVAIISQQISLFATTSLFFLVVIAYIRYLSLSRRLNIAADVVLVILSVLLLIHAVPGFDNQKVIDSVTVSPNAPAYSQYFNLDKMLLAAVFILWLVPQSERVKSSRVIKLTLIWLLISCLSITAALLTDIVSIDVKFIRLFVPWAVVNLFITCFAEELFFRGFIQSRLHGLIGNHHVITADHNHVQVSFFQQYGAVMLTALLFGLVHLPAGLSYSLIAMVLGGFYGYAYQVSRNIYVPIFMHFGFNGLHFLLLTYPYLARV